MHVWLGALERRKDALAKALDIRLQILVTRSNDIARVQKSLRANIASN